VAELRVGELAFLRVGGEGGEAVPVDVGEPQLGAGVRALLADDDAHPGRSFSESRSVGGDCDERSHARFLTGMEGLLVDVGPP
jgi:hypothetical protein